MAGPPGNSTALRNLTNADVDPAVFDAAERAALALAIKMTKNVAAKCRHHGLSPRRAS
jgi:hypothetical protein